MTKIGIQVEYTSENKVIGVGNNKNFYVILDFFIGKYSVIYCSINRYSLKRSDFI